MDAMAERHIYTDTCCTASAVKPDCRCKPALSFAARVNACTRFMINMQTLGVSGVPGTEKHWITAGHTSQARTGPATAKWLGLFVSRTPTKTGMSAKGINAAASPSSPNALTYSIMKG